jgi:hypothetical protein
MILSSQIFINIAIVLLLCIVFGYLLGLTIVNTVDRRLSDISINMPKINLPRQSINISVSDVSQRNGSSYQMKQYHPKVHVKNQFQPYRAQLDQVFRLKSPNQSFKPLQAPQNGIEGFQSVVGQDDADIVNTPPPPGLVPGLQDVPSVRDKYAAPRRGYVPLRNDTNQPKPTGLTQNNPVNPEVRPNPPLLTSPAIVPNPGVGTTANLIIDPNVDIAKIPNASPTLTAPTPVSSTVRCQNNSDCNVVYGNGKNKCLSS